MATDPNTLANGATADAPEVQDKFDELYQNIDSTNVAAGNKTGTGKFVLQTSPTVNTPTLTSPTISGTVAGGGTYTNPTLTTPIIASFTNATHDHRNAAGGGALSTDAITSGTFADARIAQTNVTQHQAALALATSQITSGTFADARIAQTNVTQHQAALSIAETQITDGSILARLASNEAVTGSWTFPSAGAAPAANALFRQSYAKASVYYVDDTGISLSHNVSSVISDDGDGYYSINWDTNQATSNNSLMVCGMAKMAGAVDDIVITYDNSTGPTSGGVEIQISRANSGAPLDSSFSLFLFGVQ